MKHKITSYRQDELYTTHQEYQTEASSDDEASAKIQHLRKSGHTISIWLQDADDTSSNASDQPTTRKHR